MRWSRPPSRAGVGAEQGQEKLPADPPPGLGYGTLCGKGSIPVGCLACAIQHQPSNDSLALPEVSNEKEEHSSGPMTALLNKCMKGQVTGVVGLVNYN